MSSNSWSYDGLKSLLNERDGQLTRDLIRVPGKFGLGQVPARMAPDAITRMVCGFCATGCSLDVHLRDGLATNITPSLDYPVNLGAACPKGWESLAVLSAVDRATEPLLRSSSGQLQPASWDRALETFCARFKKIQSDCGPDSVAFLSTGQLVNEELALLGSLTKFGMGMVHGDGNTRQCMATAVTAYKESFGFDAPPYTYHDLEESDVIVLVGGNLCIAHPIMWERICRNPHHPEIIVVDPRRTETATCSTLHLPLRAKSDLILFYGIAHLLVRNGWIDQTYVDRHTRGFAEFAQHVADFTPEIVAAETGLDTDMIERVARLIHDGRRVSFWWTMGVNQSYQGVRTAQSLINLALMTGNMGRPGTGANSITGQCNAMGSRLFSNTASLLAGRDFTDLEHRREVASILDLDCRLIPDRNSWPYHKILEGIGAGKIRGLWIVCTNPAHSWIDQQQAQQLLKKLDFLVVQDMYHTTETAQLASLILPAAGWGEKEGTLINSERRIGLVKRVVKAPGEALADFSIFKLVSEYWGCADLFRRWQDPEATFGILKDLSRQQPCDITGIADYVAIDEAGGVQWPCASDSRYMESERRLFADGKYFHADRRARFVWSDSAPMPEGADAQFPYILLTGRGTAAQWHTQTRTAKSAVLCQLYPVKLYAEIHPDDAHREGFSNGQTVTIRSRRGQIAAQVCITFTVQPGHVFLPMHYPDTNKLTNWIFDPYSYQPSYKDCAVRIEREGK